MSNAYKLRALLAETGEGLRVSESVDYRLFIGAPRSQHKSLLAQSNYYGLGMTDGTGDERDAPDRVYVPGWATSEGVQVGEIQKQRTPKDGTLTVKSRRGSLNLLNLFIKGNRHVHIAVHVVPKGTRPDNPDAWESKQINAYSTLTSRGLTGDLNTADGNDNAEIMEEYAYSPREYYEVKPMRFGAIGASTITRVALDADVFYQDGNAYLFTLHDKLSTTHPSAISVIRNDTALAQTDITALSTNGVASCLRVVGDYVVLGRSTSSSESYLYAPVKDLINGTVAFLEVTSGAVSTKGLNALYVQSASAIFAACQGGYVQMIPGVGAALATIDAGVATASNLNAIHGLGNQVIAVGASNAIILSNDFGRAGTFKSYTGPESGEALNTVWMTAPDEFYIGTATGKIHYGKYNPYLDTITYVTSIPLKGATATAITDIRFVNEVVGYVAYTTSGSAGIARTTNEGRDFNANTPEVVGVAAALPSSATAQAVVPIAGDENACYIIASASADGLIALGL
jgi:hypothetical protein